MAGAIRPPPGAPTGPRFAAGTLADGFGSGTGSGRSRRRDRTAMLARRARVDAVDWLTRTGTILIRFRVVDGETFEPEPGQFVAVDFADDEVGYRRSPYCLLSATSHTFSLLVRVVPVGPVSLFLSTLEPGDVIGFRGPTGRSMRPRPDDERLVLVATGVGIGPCLMLLDTLCRTDPTRSVSLYWGLRSEADLCLQHEFDRVGRLLTGLRIVVTLSQPGRSWNGAVGRVTAVVPASLPTLRATRFYLVGNGRMVAELGAALREVGVADHAIYEESYFHHRHRPETTHIADIVARFPVRDLDTPFSRMSGSSGILDL